MIVIDTSVLINLFRDRTGETSTALRMYLNGRDFALTRFTQMELLQGARNAEQWGRLSSYLAGQDFLEMDADHWELSARIYFDLRRKGFTVRSVVDCCIAVLAMQNDATLVHDDRDFETIAAHCPLSEERLVSRRVMGFHEDPPAPFRYE
jgi:predicted nucleic acid-binding protein